MSSLEEAAKRINERRAQQVSSFNSQNLWFREDDLVIAHFLCTGKDGDPYFDTYVAHEIPASGQGKYPTARYCPVQSGHDENYPCHGCKEVLKTKDRMIMWFWVYNVLHSVLKPNETFPQVLFNNKPYFNREINAPRVWDTSAWRESPLDDIMMLGAQLGSLHNTRVNLVTTGRSTSKRFKLYMEPNTPAIDEELYGQAIAQIRPVIEVLQDQLTPMPETVAQPTQMQPAGAATIKPFVAGPIPTLNMTAPPSSVTAPTALPPTELEFSVGKPAAKKKGEKKEFF